MLDLTPFALVWTRELLALPTDSVTPFPEEWAIVRRRIETVHRVPLPRETAPAVAPQLESGDE